LQVPHPRLPGGDVMSGDESSDLRLSVLTRWLREDLGFTDGGIAPASADASFRRYFRVTRGGDTYIAMDAPPAKESLGPYLHVAGMLAGMGLHVPGVLARNLQQGFLLLTDLGTRPYLEELSGGGEADRLYGDAIAALVRMQSGGREIGRMLPAYDRALLTSEMQLMPEWFLHRHLRLEIGADIKGMLERLFTALTQSALAQPTGFVHRDYHSRNLMLCEENNPGILDFQDAVHGPLTYDLVSLLKDCYIDWPESRVRGWILQYRGLLRRADLDPDVSHAQFVRWFDLMGLQRHIKVLGIFSRLFYRDRKPQYLQDLPRVLRYARTAAAAHPETREFAGFLTDQAARFEDAQARAAAPAPP
jgi:aminoglycoside/choline kinase family phosphotransferase